MGKGSRNCEKAWIGSGKKPTGSPISIIFIPSSMACGPLHRLEKCDTGVMEGVISENTPAADFW